MPYNKETGHIYTLCLRSFEICLNHATYPPCFASIDVFFLKNRPFWYTIYCSNSGGFCYSIAKELLMSARTKLFQPLKLAI